MLTLIPNGRLRGTHSLPLSSSRGQRSSRRLIGALALANSKSPTGMGEGAPGRDDGRPPGGNIPMVTLILPRDPPAPEAMNSFSAWLIRIALWLMVGPLTAGPASGIHSTR